MTSRSIDRRSFFRLSVVAAAACVARPRTAGAGTRAQNARSVHLHNVHTGESLRAVYSSDGQPVPDARRAIDWVLRDHRTDETHEIDLLLLDLLSRLATTLQTAAPFEVISGYRSPRSNRVLRATSTGVARKSLHLKGMAVDIRVPGHPLRVLRAAAVSQRRGGVGYYPRSGFVHVDVGAVRYW